MAEIARSLPGDVAVVEESLSSRGNIRELLDSRDIGGFFGMRGGGIGWGMGAAVGVKLANPARPVVGLIGDGSALYSYQALWTAANQKLTGIVFVILNNSSYRILKQRMRAQREEGRGAAPYLAMDLDDPLIDHVGLARSLGCEATRVSRLDEIGPAIRQGLAAGAPVLIDIALDRAV
jgi:benzoylformate decarboxylase